MNAVILAGGQGTRLWPMSLRKKPKQFFSVLSELPLIVETYNRLAEGFSPDQIYIATVEEFVPLVQLFLPQLPKDQIFVEPSKRDSGPAMAYVALQLKELEKGDEPMVYIPVDHFIHDTARFLETVRRGGEIVKDTGKLVDISVQPEFASTNLGYTHIGDVIDETNGIEAFTFLGHKEKPDHKTAKQYVESGHYLWHANYYMWTPHLFVKAIGEYAKKIADVLDEVAREKDPQRKSELYNSMPSISFDYAVTEKITPDQVVILKGDFGWSDIGTWDILQDRLKQKEADDQQNVLRGDVLAMDTRNSLIYSSSKKIIATIGVSDLIVVDTGEALLICPRGRAQEVKQLTEHLKSSGFEHYL